MHRHQSRGAIRLAANDDVMAPFDDFTAVFLRAKHSARAAASDSPVPSSYESTLCLLESDILVAIKSFVPGSAGGPDGLRPQHLTEFTSGRKVCVQVSN